MAQATQVRSRLVVVTCRIYGVLVTAQDTPRPAGRSSTGRAPQSSSGAARVAPAQRILLYHRE
jgi:hypothetical protein